MKRFFLALCAILALALPVVALDVDTHDQSSACAQDAASPAELCTAADADDVSAVADADAERRGCCSWHGGVCGCASNGHAQCCDGSPSPSCGC